MTSTWRITRRVGAWPRWLLFEDVIAHDFVIAAGGRRLTLYRAEVVIDTPRRVVVRRMDARDIVAVEEL